MRSFKECLVGVVDEFNEINDRMDRESVFEQIARIRREEILKVPERGLIAYKRMTPDSGVLSSSRCQRRWSNT